jgi:hypothetical protein
MFRKYNSKYNSKYKMITKKLKKVCKHLKIRLTIMHNGKRFPKSEKVLIKQLKKKMKKVRFGAEKRKAENTEKIEPWHKRHRKKLKIAAGVLAAAAVIGGGHYAATRTEAGQKHLTGYNKLMNTTGKNIKTQKPGSKPETPIVVQKSAEELQHEADEKAMINSMTPAERYVFNENKRKEKEAEVEAKKQAEEAKKQAKQNSVLNANNALGVLVGASTGDYSHLNYGDNPALGALVNPLLQKGVELAKEQGAKLMEGGEEVDKLKEQLVEAQQQGHDTTELEQQISAKEAENAELVQETAEIVTNKKEIEEKVKQISDLNEKVEKSKTAKNKKEGKLTTQSIQGIKKRIAKLEKELKELGGQQSNFGKRSRKRSRKSSRKSSFGKSYRQRIYNSSKNIYRYSKKKFYEVSKMIAKGMLSGIGIFAGVTISIITLFKYMEYRKIKLDPMVVLRLFKSTDSKGKLHVDRFVNSAKRIFDTHAPHFVSTLAKEVRKEVPGVVKEATISGLGVIQENSMMLMMPMMMALSSYFSKQMGDLSVASVKKSRNVSGLKGWETRRKNESKTVSSDLLSDIVNNSYQTTQRRNAAAKKIQQVYKKKLPSLRYKRHLKEHNKMTPLYIRQQASDAINKLREQLKVHRFGKRKF